MDQLATLPDSVYEIGSVILVGLLIGFIANRLMGDGGLGLVWSAILGLIGSVVGGSLFSLFGVSVAGFLGHIGVGVIGACVVLYVAKKLRR